MDWILKGQLLSSLFMLGVIWIIQVVHYPLMAKVGPDNFVTYERLHTQLITYIVLPPMLLELGSAILLALRSGPQGHLYCINLGIVLLIWASTFFIQVPLHNQLSQTHNPELVRQLVQTNWIRTALWSLKGIGLLWFLL